MKNKISIKIPDLEDKVVLITGASTGIGAALAIAFAEQGAKVALHYNSSKEKAEAVAYEIKKKGGVVSIFQGDVSKTSMVNRIVHEVVSTFGHLDGLINNAGGMVARRTYEDMTDEYYDAVMDLNGRSVLAASSASLPYLKKNGGFIINTSSVGARNGASGGAGLYCSAKSLVSNVTRGMAKEFIPFGIRVNAVAPGVITTPFHERYSNDAQMQASLAAIPQGRFGTPLDCVGAYLFLASNVLSSYIIGQTIEVNGGQLMP